MICLTGINTERKKNRFNGEQLVLHLRGWSNITVIEGIKPIPCKHLRVSDENDSVTDFVSNQEITLPK